MEVNFKVTITKTKLHSIWESGGHDGKKGHARLIADKKGGKKKYIFLNREHDPNGNHALFALNEGDFVVTNKMDKNKDNILISKVMGFVHDEEENTALAICKVVWVYNGNMWSRPCIEISEIKKETLAELVMSVKNKARHKDCTETYYSQTKK